MFVFTDNDKINTRLLSHSKCYTKYGLHSSDRLNVFRENNQSLYVRLIKIVKKYKQNRTNATDTDATVESSCAEQRARDACVWKSVFVFLCQYLPLKSRQGCIDVHLRELCSSFS